MIFSIPDSRVSLETYTNVNARARTRQARLRAIKEILGRSYSHRLQGFGDFRILGFAGFQAFRIQRFRDLLELQGLGVVCRDVECLP